MSHAVKRICSPVWLAVMAALPLAAHADSSPVIASTYAGVNNLRYELIDLNPNDGITPGITFNSSVTVASSNDNGVEDTLYTNSLLPLTSITRVSHDGMASVQITPNSLSARTDIRLNQLLPDGVANGNYSANADMSLSMTNPDGMPEDYPWPWTFGKVTITPNTALVLKGDAQLGSSLDGTAIQAQLQPGQYLSLSNFSSGPSIVLGFLKNDSVYSEKGAVGGGAMHVDALDLEYIGYPTVGQGTGQTSDSVSVNTPFEVSLVNLHDTPLDGQLVMSLGNVSSPNLTIDGVPIDPIPEPATYALMGLGLVGITLVRRRQSR
jgi:hypothetical protein